MSYSMHSHALRPVSAILALLFAVFACGDDPSPTDPNPTDTTSPTVSLTASSDAVTSEETLSLQAAATDNVGVASVTFRNGSATVGTATASPFNASVSIDASLNGTHMFTAVARDAAGNEATSNTVTVDVAIPNLRLADDFGDGAIDSTQWTVTEQSATLAETNGRLELTIPAVITEEVAAARLRTTCTLPGDFDASVDYELLNWPADSGARLQLGAAGVSSERLSPGPTEAIGESYAANHTQVGGTLALVSTTDASGRLRIARVGSQLSSYRWDGAQWVLLNTTTAGSVDAASVGIGLAISEQFDGGVGASAAFDNFSLTTGEDPTC